MKPNARRTLFTADAQFAVTKADKPTDGKIGTLKGYALLWNVLSSDRGNYAVRLMPKSARFAPLTHALYHHMLIGGPLGDTETGTLRILAADDVGQPVEIDLPDTSLGRDVLELVRTRRLKGMSFAMADGIEEGTPSTEGGVNIVNALSYLVDEVTITARPSFEQASIDVADDKEDDDYAVRRDSSIRLEQLKLDMYAL